MKAYMAIGGYCGTLHLGYTKHPRKELIEKCGHGGRISKQYTEMKDGSYFHSGYVIGNAWYTLYEVKPFNGGL